MSGGRILATTGIVALAAVCAPAAAAPGINSADMICILAPVALVAVLAGRSRKGASR